MNSGLLALRYFALFFAGLFWGNLAISGYKKIVPSPIFANLDPGLRSGLRLGIPLLILFAGLCLLPELHPALPPAASDFRAFYMHPWFFSGRTILFFTFGDFGARRFLRNKALAGPFVLIATFLITSFFAVDWIEAFEPRWHSTVFGALVWTSALLLALGFDLAFAPASADKKDLIRLNNLHLSVAAAWLYLNVIQLIVVWSGNLPDESGWYLPRLGTAWKFLIVACLIFQFLLPFPLLLFRRLKESPVFTRRLGFLTVFAQSLFLAWIVFPAGLPRGPDFVSVAAAFLVSILTLAWIARERSAR